MIQCLAGKHFLLPEAPLVKVVRPSRKDPNLPDVGEGVSGPLTDPEKPHRLSLCCEHTNVKTQLSRILGVLQQYRQTCADINKQDVAPAAKERGAKFSSGKKTICALENPLVQ